MLTRIIAPAVALALLLVAPAAAPAKRAAPPEPAFDVIVVAKLVERTGKNLPLCGILHVAEAMRYQVIKVERGVLTEKTLWVAHGCPGMPRSMYGGAAAGTLKQFKVGDIHRLRLTKSLPAGAGGPTIFNPPKGVRIWWTVRVDPR